MLVDGQSMPERTLFWNYGNSLAMRDGPWKWIQPSKNNPAGSDTAGAGLFNLATDPAESNDLARQQQKRFRSMQAAARAWRESVFAGATVQPDKPAATE